MLEQHYIFLLAFAVFVAYPVFYLRLKGRQAIVVVLAQLVCGSLAVVFAKGLAGLISGDGAFSWILSDEAAKYIFAEIRFQGAIFFFAFFLIPAVLIWREIKLRSSVRVFKSGGKEACVRLFNVDPLRYLDAIALAFSLAFALACIVCFLNGCCIGHPCEGMFCVEYHRGTSVFWRQVAAHELPPHHVASRPVLAVHALLALVSIVGFILLRSLSPRLLNPGRVACFYLVGVEGVKAFLDGFRDPYLWQLQLLSLAMACMGGFLYLFFRHTDKKYLLYSGGFSQKHHKTAAQM